MTSLLNSAYTNLNDLIYINADNIDTNSISTNSLYLNNVLLDLSNYATSNQLADTNAIVNNLQVKLSICTFNSLTSEFQINGNMKVSNNLVLYMSGANINVGDFITNTNSSITSTNSSISTINTKLTDVSRDVGLGAFVLGGTSDMRLSNKLYLVINGYPSDINTYIQNNIININSLTSKTTDISYSGTTTTIGNNLVINNIDGYSKTEFDNAISKTKSLTNDAQTQITDLKNSLIAVGIITTTTTGLVMTGYFLIIQGELLSLSTRITNCEDHDTTLLARTTKISYSDTTDTTTIAGAQLTVTNTIACSSLETNDIKSSGDINQIYVNNKNNTFRNPTYFQHNIELQNNKGFLIDAGSTFENNGITTLNNTLNVNSTSNFYSNVKIRDNTTTNSGTIDPYLNVCSTSTNVLARKLQGITIGVEQVLNNQSNCNIGYNYVSDGSTSNYGYLGLNVGSLNVIESIRWSPTKVLIQNGNFEVANNTNIIGSLTCNTIQNSGANSTPLAITCTGVNNNMVLTSSANLNLFANSGAIKLNSNDIQIGTNQSALVNNVVSIGTIASNTTCIIPNIVKTNNITGYNTGSVLSINNPAISIGTNQGVGVINTISIGNTTSGSIISLNGAVLVNGYMSNITNLSLSGIFTQF